MGYGAHIKVSRGAYDHHGIDVGGGEVIHYSGEMNAEKKNAVICRISKAEFAAGGSILIVIHEEGNCFSSEETVSRAEQHLGEGAGQYTLWGNNCEHFARWCKTGKKESKQVDRVVKGAIGGTVARGVATRIAGAALGPWGWVITGIGFLAGLLSDKDKTKPDDEHPKIEDKGEDKLEDSEGKQ